MAIILDSMMGVLVEPSLATAGHQKLVFTASAFFCRLLAGGSRQDRHDRATDGRWGTVQVVPMNTSAQHSPSKIRLLGDGEAAFGVPPRLGIAI